MDRGTAYEMHLLMLTRYFIVQDMCQARSTMNAEYDRIKLKYKRDLLYFFIYFNNNLN